MMSTTSDISTVSSQLASPYFTSVGTGAVVMVVVDTGFVVDDDVFYAREIAKMLKSDYAVRICNSPDDLIAKIVKEEPNVIVMDYEMPGVNGGEITKLLKDNPNYQKIPVILTSGINYEMAEEIMKSRIFADYVSKRQLRELKTKIEKFLNRE